MKKIIFISLILTSCATRLEIYRCDVFTHDKVEVCSKLNYNEIQNICEQAEKNIAKGYEIGMPEFCQ